MLLRIRSFVPSFSLPCLAIGTQGSPATGAAEAHEQAKRNSGVVAFGSGETWTLMGHHSLRSEASLQSLRFYISLSANTILWPFLVPGNEQMTPADAPIS